MATPFVYTLLTADEYADSGTVTGDGFPTLGRTAWSVTGRVGKLSPGGSVTLVVQTAPADEDEEYETKATLNDAAITAEGVYTKALTLTRLDRFLRVKRTAQTGDAIYEAVGSAPFLDPATPADKDMVSKELRVWSDGLTRTVEQAERDVRSVLLHNDRAKAQAGRLDVFWTEAIYDEIRGMIAEQADWLFMRHKVREKAARGDAAAAKELESLADTAPDLSDRARKMRRVEAQVWLGR